MGSRRNTNSKALLLAGALSACVCLGAHAAPNGAVQLWITTGDKAHLLEQQADLPFSEPGTAGPVISIDPNHRYQEMAGFGAALTDASALLIQNKLSPEQRATLLKDLFGSEGGISLSVMRLTIGASDFSPTHYSFDDLPKGQRDPQLKHFSIDPNRAAVLPITKQILNLNSGVKIMATPWSAPGWMKTSGSLIGGSLKPADYGLYAQYLKKYVEAYSGEGVPIYALTIQNEPGFAPGDYPGMRVTAKSRAQFLGNHFGPLMAKSFPDLRILDWDHNWDKPSSPLRVLGDRKASRYVAGVAWHCYAGDVSAQSSVHKAYPDKDTWLTECAGGEWAPEFASSLSWQSRNLVIGGTRNWAKGVLLWNLALDESHGPHFGGCDNCRGVVTIDSGTGAVTRNVEYYVLGHASRFVHAGAVRIDSGTPASGLDHAAFYNKDDQSTVLLIFNDNTAETSFSVKMAERSFAAKLPPKTLATFVWR